jgi:thioredoxin reductase
MLRGMKSYDVVIVGGGPAGLSAALALGRARRSALLVDGDTPRNARAEHLHNFVTRDGTPPKEFRAIARAQLTPYDSVAVRDAMVGRVAPVDGGFDVTIEGEVVRARRILLASGVRDEVPAIEGLAEQWGRTSFQCPYCHGWELRDRPWGVLVTGDALVDWATFLTNWASTLVAFTNGAVLSEESQQKLRAARVSVEAEPLARLHGTRDALESIELRSGKRVPANALVLRPAQRPVDLVLALGLERDELGFVRVNPMTRESSVPGVHVAGDATTMMQGAINAAADGTMSGAMINHAIVMENIARAAALR